ncbi:inositol monophosphatase family protein [Kiloniella laminariae]|uniref:Inositol-1-monophosphatase n=1 Tax=Kiloniella laminariae TaxID=454162 RepID=A0ABT4LIA5_9PROT|nr:inositol monophosphatase family protein [Kiloniella laminariae]MCZ4280828.1 inositol monophosphatase family protein [Kiloniella laminariae]
MAYRSPRITVMAKAAEKAARSLKRDFGEVENLQVSKKGPADFVSAADLKAEKILKDELKRARPEFGFLTEEAGIEKGSSPDERWIIDPLDGTTNFLHGLPHFAISIALEVRGEIVAGVIYDPIKDEMFTAEKGNGAYLNDRRIRVSARVALETTVVATGTPYLGRGDRGPFLREVNAVMAQTAGIRRWGAAALDLAYVACGRYDAFWERDLSSWDVAAGILMVKEAGGTVSEVEGRPIKLESPSILCANIDLHPKMLKLFKESGKY